MKAFLRTNFFITRWFTQPFLVLIGHGSYFKNERTDWPFTHGKLTLSVHGDKILLVISFLSFSIQKRNSTA